MSHHDAPRRSAPFSRTVLLPLGVGALLIAALMAMGLAHEYDHRSFVLHPTIVQGEEVP